MATRKDQQVITLLTATDREKLDSLAEANGLNRSEMVRHLIRNAIAPRRPFDPTLPQDPDGHTYETVVEL